METLQEVTRLKLSKLQGRMEQTHGIKLEIKPEVVNAVAARCTEVETGARNVDHIIRGNLLPRLSTEILQAMGAEALPKSMSVGLDDSGDFVFEVH